MLVVLSVLFFCYEKLQARNICDWPLQTYLSCGVTFTLTEPLRFYFVVIQTKWPIRTERTPLKLAELVRIPVVSYPCDFKTYRRLERWYSRPVQPLARP